MPPSEVSNETLRRETRTEGKRPMIASHCAIATLLDWTFAADECPVSAVGTFSRLLTESGGSRCPWAAGAGERIAIKQRIRRKRALVWCVACGLRGAHVG